MTAPRAPAKSRAPVGSGRVLLWRGGSVWVGRDVGAIAPHAHHAIQVTLAPDRPIRLRSPASADWRELHAAVVMPDRPHQLDGCGHEMALVFVEPETAAGRALCRDHGGADISALDDPVVREASRALLRAFAERAPDDVLLEQGRRIVELLVGPGVSAPSVDARITKVLEWIRDHLDAPISLEQAAAVACLSPSRFRHLFVAQTGISFRAYLLWTRVSQAIARGMAGESWTEAAQQAGFADSAHLSRTCRRMFGVAPSMLERED